MRPMTLLACCAVLSATALGGEAAPKPKLRGPEWPQHRGNAGGTGVSPRDVTADATAGVLDRPIPGIAEAIRASGLAAGAVDAGLSRGLAGVSGSTLVVNLAPSRAAVRDGMATLTPLVANVIAELSDLDAV